MFLEEDKEKLKKKILSAYCFSKPSTKFSQVIDALGLEVGTKLVDKFWGQVVAIPTRNALQRGALPKIIQSELEDSKPNSDQFKLKVKDLSRFYKLPKRAIVKMNETGRYTR